MTRALVTGFEPFAGSAVNPSERLVEALAAAPPDGLELATALLPVSYARAGEALAHAVRTERPDLVVCFGQARGRPGISVERVALNLDDAAEADNEGVVSAAEIDPEGPVGYRSTLPVDAIVAALRAAGIPAAASRDAGGFLCNRVFYSLMRLLERERPDASGGFVHVPLLPEQALEQGAARCSGRASPASPAALPAPSMPLALLERAAHVVLATAAG